MFAREIIFFKGFIISDWVSVEQLERNYKQRLTTSINEGVDTIMATGANDWRTTYCIIMV
jgi:beta-glucosidase-like glycosyl hydrolase